MAFRIGLVSRLDDTRALDVAVTLAKQLRKKGSLVTPELDLAKRGHLGGGEELSDLKPDLFVTVGGDGTVLKTSMSISDPETPILAVNMGRRGYLTEVEPNQALRAVELFMKGKCKLERRTKLGVFLDGAHVVDALNELAVSSGTPSKMLEFKVSAGSEQILQSRADGVIVSTATGSTAYSLSAGGPVVDFSLDAYVITFICPLEFMRPRVVSMARPLSVQLVTPKQRALVVADGRFQRELGEDVKLVLRKAEHPAVFVRVGATPTLGGLMRLRGTERAGL
jgi:NAD+ kinase